MALSITFTHHGVTVQDGYLKVSQYGGDKDFLRFDLDFKTNAEEAPIKRENFSCPMDLGGSNPVAQAYEHLKTLPEFSAAEDV